MPEALWNLPTFRLKKGADDPLATLTTPVAYLTTYSKDPFSPEPKYNFCYWVYTNDKNEDLGWILWSAGPDEDYDITLDNVGKFYDPTTSDTLTRLMLGSMTYDPTNGTNSSGDVWRVKE